MFRPPPPRPGQASSLTGEECGKAKEDGFTEQLGLENGIPSHDTFGNVFAAIDTEAFVRCFSRWVTDLANLTSGEVWDNNFLLKILGII